MRNDNQLNEKKKILLVGGGGREHAIAWKLAQSPKVETIFVAPGNGGTQDEPKVQNVSIASTAIDELVDFAMANAIDLTIVGPELPLAGGITDLFERNGLFCLGPKKAAARIESSKVFAKKFMQRHHIPTTHYAEFSCIKKAQDYLKTQKMPLVIKADGLTAGKGVAIVHSREEAQMVIDNFLVKKKFGSAGETIIIEEYAHGKEVSAFILSDGKDIVPLVSVQDHKQLGEGNHGPNTGGMGAMTPVSWLTDEQYERIMHEVMLPTIKGLHDEGIPFVGFLYAGLMITPAGVPKVLEFNCRLGDPETQPLMMRMESDFFDLCNAVFNGTLSQQHVKWSSHAVVGLVLASDGYPLSYKKGYSIEGLSLAQSDIKIFHAGTQKKNGQFVTSGGRVLCVTSIGDSIVDAREKAYLCAQEIKWPGRFFRSDIGVF